MNEEERTRARVLADPIKASLRDVLLWEGPMTGARLARAVPQASRSLTYHLRALEQVGAVREVAGGGGRTQQKIWQATETRFEWDSAAKDPIDALIAQSVDRTVEDLNYERVKEWGVQKRAGDWSPEWVKAASQMTFKLCVTPAELDECIDEVVEVLDRWKKRTADRKPSDEAENVAFSVTANPRRISS